MQKCRGVGTKIVGAELVRDKRVPPFLLYKRKLAVNKKFLSLILVLNNKCRFHSIGYRYLRSQ
jgi:hypothetical protein